MAQSIALRPALPADAPALAALFRASVETLGAEDYSQAQVEACSPLAGDEAEFGAELAQKLTTVATLGGALAGFAALKGTEVLDMLYVHPQFARRGVASALCDAMEKLASARKAKKLAVDASDGAEKFFARRGYLAQKRNMVFLGDEVLGNTTMTKDLAAMTGPLQ
jgi:putative acetyltransferase